MCCLTAAPDRDVICIPTGMGSGICGLIAVRDLLGLKMGIVGVIAVEAPALRCARGGLPVKTNAGAAFRGYGPACRDP